MLGVYKGINDQPSAVLELCDGSLQDLIDSRKEEEFHEDEILEIITTVAKSLKYVHSKDIIHRDLKPDNILFKNTGGIRIWKLTDFGSSVKRGRKFLTTVKPKITHEFASIE
jgi:serine/threonine protein kinase